MNVTERFLNYVVYDTQTKEIDVIPNTVTEFANIRQMNQCVELIKELLTIQ